MLTLSRVKFYIQFSPQFEDVYTVTSTRLGRFVSFLSFQESGWKTDCESSTKRISNTILTNTCFCESVDICSGGVDMLRGLRETHISKK